MTIKHKNILLIILAVGLFVSVTLNIFLAATDSKVAEDTEMSDKNIDVGKYIYYEPSMQTIHVDRKCKKINKRSRIERVELSGIVDWKDRDLKNNVISNFCPMCVSDEDYDIIMETITEQIFEKYDNER